MAGLVFKDTPELIKAREGIAQAELVMIPQIYIRSCYKKNGIIYEPGGIKEKGAVGSYFQNLFRKNESVYAEEGKFTQRGHVPFNENLPTSKVDREKTTYDLGDSNININDTILNFYMGQLDFLCEPGEDSREYGWAVLADIQILDTLSKRIIGGGIEVADAKYVQYPKEFREAAKMGGPGSDAALMEMLTVPKKEIEVLNRVLKRAKMTGMKNPGFVHDMFGWVILHTKDAQVKRMLELYEKGLYA
jgi:hypothetical protein